VYVFLSPFLSFIDISLKVKGTFLTAIGIFEIGSLICALAPSSTVLIVGRAIAGIGVGGLFSGALVIIAHTSLYRTLFPHAITYP
jgi:predicted MFS family arabinose efflux permease